MHRALKLARASGETIVLDRGKHVPAKICVVCKRLFTWRKKWERCWDEVSTCSKQCNKQRKRELRNAKRNTDRATKVSLEPKIKGQKRCTLCSKYSNTLIRCSISPGGKKWIFSCGSCWRKPEVANGVIDGHKSNPHYRYGGLWKNLHV
eukprot:GSMAST32.ASY1.ANO1.142.1 assembled CDS